MSTFQTFPCPLCGRDRPVDPRYPNAVCSSCAALTTDRAGRALRFYNESLSGGVLGVYRDTGESFQGNTCFIRGVACQVEEAHLGGVVFIPQTSKPGPD